MLIQDSWNQFETEFVDTRTCRRYTVTFWRGEPVLYHPPHLAKPEFTHISGIANDYFVVGSSTTGRMIPFAQSQQVLQLKLDLADIEREVHGDYLDAPERLIWRRWVDAENQRASRKSRVRAPCCGRSKFRHQLEADDAGELWCMDCWSLPTHVCNTAFPAQLAERSTVPEVVSPNPNEAADYPWRQKVPGDAIAPPPTKRQCLRGVVEQGGSCFVAAFEHCKERVLVYQKDMLGVPTYVGQPVEACNKQKM